MSLVNDMLRDLDKRRKESSGSTGSMPLTPVPELAPESSGRPLMLYLIAALLLGAGAVAWFWMQQDSGSTTRELNIAPQLVAEPNTPPPETPGNSTATVDQTQEASSATVDTQADNPAQPQQEVARVSTPDQTVEPVLDQQGPASDIEQIAEPDSSSEAIVLAENEVSQQPPADGQEGPENSSAGVEITVAEREDVDAGTEAQGLINLSQTQPSATSDIKNISALSPEDRDVLTVQKALQLISEGKTTEAYAMLEQQIIDNHYANQSRETYAKLLISDGNLRGALELAETGLELSPNHRGFKKVKARLLIAQGMLQEAIDLLISRAPPVDADLEYHEILATAQLASRDYEGALISYTGLVRQDQTQGRWWYGFAASQDSLGNLSAARQGYSRAVGLSNLSASLRRRSQERLAVLSQ